MPLAFCNLSFSTKRCEVGFLADVAEILRTQQFLEGPFVEALEQRLAAELDAAFVVACSSGTQALLLALQGLGIQPGAKVALPNVTFWATYEAVIQRGGIPVLIDIDPEDAQMDFDSFCAAHRQIGFDAAILVHLFGWTSHRLQDFRAYCAAHHITLLEDGAQAYGVRVHGTSLFAEATLGTLSFYPTKVLGGVMDGGALVTQDEALAVSLRMLRNHGRRGGGYTHADVGWNARMSSLQAAYLLRACAQSGEILTPRRQLAQAYRNLFASKHGVHVYGPPAGVEDNGYLNVLIAPPHTGVSLAHALGQQGIGAARIYPEPLSAQAPARDAIRFGTLAHSLAFCRHVVNLPLYDGMTREQGEEAAACLWALVH